MVYQETDTNNISPDWKILEGKAAQDVTFCYYAYGEDDAEMQDLADEIPKGYELFLMTDHVQDSKKSYFRCVAFMNQDTKDIVFATAGSRFIDMKKGMSDLLDDVLLVTQHKPRKMKAAEILNDMILDSLGDQAVDYKFHYTGHSLGAAMAEIQAADMDIKLTQRNLRKEGGEQKISAITFENLGTREIIEKMYEKAGVSKDSIKKINFCEFNNRKNVINSLNEQVGKTYTIIPYDQEERNPSSIQMVFEVVAKIIGDKISPMLGNFFALLAPGGITDDLVNEHALDQFDEVFVQKSGIVEKSKNNIIPLEEAYSGIKPIKFDSNIAAEMSKLKKKNGNIGKQKFSMTSIEKPTNQIRRMVFSEVELQNVIKKLSPMRKEERGRINSRKGVDILLKSPSMKEFDRF